jgi:cobalt-zinc-cadmium resistance protein CzcA
MLERIMTSALHHRMGVLLLVALIIGLGTMAFVTLPIDAFPDVTKPQVEIVSNAPGLAPLEIEKFVTAPVEMAMRGLPGLELMRSTTKYGLSVVTLVFADNVDIYFARQLVFERLTRAKEKLPEGVETEMGPIATAMGEIYQYTLAGEMPDDPNHCIRRLAELRTLQDWVVAPILKGVPGVSEINSFGGYLKQYHVVVDPQKLLIYKLSVRQVYEAIRNNNHNVGGGVMERFSEQMVIRGIGLIRDENDIANIVLKTRDGVPVFVRDVAQVQESHAIRQGSAFKDGRSEAVGSIVLMLKGQNSRDVVKRVQAKVREINEGTVLPAGLKIEPFYERSEIVGRSIHTVVETLAEGAVLVVLVLYLLLRSLRGALIVILALPLSLLLTFILMKVLRLDANLMSLGGLAISIGMIIDATIIQVENVQRHLGHSRPGSHKLATVLQAVMEVRKPSIFGELIIALTFVPIITLKGMEGKMFSPLAFTVAIALFASLFLSILVIPVLCSLMLREGAEKESLSLRWIRALYLPLLHAAMRHRVTVVVLAATAVTAALLVAPHLGTEFVPIMDEGAFDMDIQLVPGASLTHATAIVQKIEEQLMKFPELRTVLSRTGQTGIAVEARGVDKTGFVGALRPRAQWTSASSREDLTNQMREAIADIPGLAFGFSQPIQCRIDELVAGTRAQIILKLFGDDADVLQTKIAQIAAILARVRGATDLVTEVVTGQPYINIQVDRQAIARYGLNVNEVLDVIEIAIGGKPASQIYEENRTFDVVVRFPDAQRNDPDRLRGILIDSPQGYRIPLGQLADISLKEGAAQINRENGQRRMAVECNVTRRDIGSFVGEAQQRIRQQVTLPSGYYLSWGGQFENQQQAMRRLTIITPIIVGLILLLLFWTFNSIRLALLVVCNLPFALVGGVFLLLATGLYLSVPASVGFIVLFGVAVLNGVVLVSYISQSRQQDRSVAEVVAAACNNRLRPILMTASITVFSLIPMLLATGPGAEVQRPLATVVVGGLFTSTLATLLVLPAMYGWFERRDAGTNPERVG